MLPTKLIGRRTPTDKALPDRNQPPTDVHPMEHLHIGTSRPPGCASAGAIRASEELTAPCRRAFAREQAARDISVAEEAVSCAAARAEDGAQVSLQNHRRGPVRDRCVPFVTEPGAPRAHAVASDAPYRSHTEARSFAYGVGAAWGSGGVAAMNMAVQLQPNTAAPIRRTEILETVVGDITVPTGAACAVLGVVIGSLVVEPGASAVIRGTVNGVLVNYGGDVEVFGAVGRISDRDPGRPTRLGSGAQVGW